MRSSKLISLLMVILLCGVAAIVLMANEIARGDAPSLAVNSPPTKSYYQGIRMYADLMKMAEKAGSFATIDGGDPGPLNAQGWPTGNWGVQVTAHARYLPGTYRIIADGRLESMTIRANKDDKATDLVYDPVKNQTTGKLVLTRGDIGLAFYIKGTNLGRVQVLRPGAALGDGGFTPEFIAELRKHGTYRWMEAQLTNVEANDIRTWNDRPLRTDPTYTRRGIPWEDIFEASNLADCQPWLSVPEPLDDAGVIKLATMARDRLKPSLLPIWELDNESWGTHFIQGQRNADAAMEEQKTDPLLRASPWGGPGDWNVWRWNRHMKRVAHLNDLLLQVYGSRDKYRLVLNGQWASPNAMDVQLAYLKARKLKLSDVVHAVAIAPYADLLADPAADLSAYFAPGGIGVQVANDELVKKWDAIAAAQNVRLWAYEAGPNFLNSDDWNQVYPSKVAAQSDPRIAALVTNFIDRWFSVGPKRFDDDRLLCWFFLAGPWLDRGPAANFGLVEDLADLRGPKYAAFIAAEAKYRRPTVTPTTVPIVLPEIPATKPTTPTTVPVVDVKPINVLKSGWMNLSVDGKWVYVEVNFADGKSARGNLEIKDTK